MSWKNGVWVADERQNTVNDPKNRVEAEAATANQLAVGAERMSRMAPAGQPPATPAPVSPDVQAQVAGKQQANSGNLMGKVAGMPNMFAKPDMNMGATIPRQPITQVQQPQQSQQAPEKKTKVPSMGNATRTPSTGMDYLASMFTPPEDEERMRKASLANMKILALGDALRHIGNIYHTTKYAPNQQFNNPALEQWQQYQQGKAVRDAANRHYAAYQQQKAAQDARNKQWELDFNLKVGEAARRAGVDEARIKNMQEQLANQRAYQQGQLDLGKQRAADQKAYREQQLKQQDRHNRAMEGAAYMNANSSRMRAKAYVDRLKGGGNASSMPLQTPKGSIYAPGKSIPQPQMNQLYKFAVDNGYIEKSEFQKKMSEAGFGKADPDYVRNQLVAEAMMKHSEVSDYAQKNYHWRYGDHGDGGSGEGLSIGWDDDEDDNGLSIGW